MKLHLKKEQNKDGTDGGGEGGRRGVGNIYMNKKMFPKSKANYLSNIRLSAVMFISQ